MVVSSTCILNAEVLLECDCPPSCHPIPRLPRAVRILNTKVYQTNSTLVWRLR